MHAGGNDRQFLFSDSSLIFFCFDDHPSFRLIQWNPSPAPAGQPLPDDSSESDGHSPVPYGELDALRFKAELETAQRELEDVSKKAGIAELEWEDQRKQLLETIDGTALSGIHPGYSCKERGRVEDELLLEFPCTPTRTRSV
jgi:hypothetical protein